MKTTNSTGNRSRRKLTRRDLHRAAQRAHRNRGGNTRQFGGRREGTVYRQAIKPVSDKKRTEFLKKIESHDKHGKPAKVSAGSQTPRERGVGHKKV